MKKIKVFENLFQIESLGSGFSQTVYNKKLIKSNEKYNETRSLEIQFERNFQFFFIFFIFPQIQTVFVGVFECVCVFEQIVFVYLYIKYKV